MNIPVREFSTHAMMKYCFAIVHNLLTTGGKITVTLGLDDALAIMDLAADVYIKSSITSGIGSYRYTVTLGE